MGKRKNPRYDEQNLKALAKYLEGARRPLEGGKNPTIKVDPERLEETIKTSLDEKDRKVLEKFFGLIPGKINHSQRRSAEISWINMYINAKKAMMGLVTIENLEKFDANVHEKVMLIAKKVNTEGTNVSNADTVKYLYVLSIIFDGGPNMSFDMSEKIDIKYEKLATFDEFAMLDELCKVLNELPDNSINLKLLMEAIEMLDLDDVVSIKKFAGLPMSREESLNFRDETKAKSLYAIRCLKEKIFPYGAWNETLNLILGKEKQASEFVEAVQLIRKDWKSIERYRTDETERIFTSKGIQTVKKIRIGELEFTDPYEVMLLCVARNIAL